MRFPFRNIFKTDFIWVLFLALIAGIIAGANYTPGTFLTGWDTLHPEFDFGLAFYRMLTSVWRQDQGLGAVAIQSHIAELPRVALLWLASLALPINTLRYVTFLCSLAVGSSGVYLLTRHMVKDNKHAYNFPSFFAGIAYLTNLVTVQHFVVPLEMFAIHYALVPWLFYTATRILESGKRMWLLLFALITLLATPQAQTATLFYAYAAVLSLYLATYVILHRSTGKRVLVRAIMILGITFSINAFWMLPNIYAAMHHGNDVRESAVNQLFSDEAYAKTAAFGTPLNAMIGKNFLFDWQLIDPTTGAQVDVLTPWIGHLKQPMVLSYYYLLFALAVVGVITVVKRKNTRAIALLPVFIATFMVLLNGTWPVSYFFNQITGLSPILQEALRFSFTKFSILYILSLSVFVGYGLTCIFGYIRTRVVTISLGILLFVYATYAFLPAITGNLVSPAMRIAIPNEYFQMFSWFRQKDWNGRVAILPIHSFWNWANYSWGYQGAGFLQFGIPQPILDRDYDRWSPYNENYYWEMSRAVYAKDAPSVERVLTKYDVHYILLDESIVSRENNRSVYTEELKGILDIIWNIKEVARFGKLTVYERLGGDSQSFVSLKPNLPTVSPAYGWTDNDVAYGEVGDYIVTANGKRQTEKGNGIIFPFRSLFTKRSASEREFTIEETEDAITILPLLFGETSGISLKRDIHKQKDNNEQRIRDAYFYIDVRPVDHSASFSSQMASTNETIPPSTLIVKGNTFAVQSVYSTLGKISNAPNHPADRLVNKPENTRKPEGENARSIPITVSNESLAVNVILKSDTIVYDSTKSADLVAENVQPCGALREGEATAKNIDQFLEFTSRNQRGCLSFGVGNLSHREGYLIAVESRHIAGRPLLFSLINQTAKHVELETYLQPQRVRPFEATDYFILPPLASDGLGYTVYLSNDAIGQQESINDIKSIKFYRIPYQELVSMSLRANAKQSLEIATSPAAPRDDILRVDHPNPAYYKIKMDMKQEAISGISQTQTLVLSQSFDPGWIALQKNDAFPYVTLLKNHVLVNNWSNGWSLPSNQVTNNESTIILFFLPQLLQWIGFFLLPIPFIMTMQVIRRESPVSLGVLRFPPALPSPRRGFRGRSRGRLRLCP